MPASRFRVSARIDGGTGPVKLVSHGTGGARQRMRYHCREHCPLVYRGRSGDALVFEVHADDGRTYTLRLSADDVAGLAQAATEAKGR